MSTQTKWLRLFLILVIGVISIVSHANQAPESVPSVRSLGPLTMEQVYGTIPGPLPLGQSLLLVWPQVTGLIAATVICFALSYVSFMRREIRSR